MFFQWSLTDRKWVLTEWSAEAATVRLHHADDADLSCLLAHLDFASHTSLNYRHPMYNINHWVILMLRRFLYTHNEFLKYFSYWYPETLSAFCLRPVCCCLCFCCDSLPSLAALLHRRRILGTTANFTGLVHMTFYTTTWRTAQHNMLRHRHLRSSRTPTQNAHCLGHVP